MASVSSHPHLMASPSQLTTTPIEDEAMMNNNNNYNNFDNNNDDGESISISMGCDDSTLDTFETPAYHHHAAAVQCPQQPQLSQLSSPAVVMQAVEKEAKKMKRVDAHDVMSLPNFYPRPSLNHSHNHNINNHSNNHNCKMNNEGGHSDEISIVSSRSVRRRDVIKPVSDVVTPTAADAVEELSTVETKKNNKEESEVSVTRKKADSSGSSSGEKQRQLDSSKNSRRRTVNS